MYCLTNIPLHSHLHESRVISIFQGTLLPPVAWSLGSCICVKVDFPLSFDYTRSIEDTTRTHIGVKRPVIVIDAMGAWDSGILGFGEPGPIEGSSRGCLAENRCGLRTQGFLVYLLSAVGDEVALGCMRYRLWINI